MIRGLQTHIEEPVDPAELAAHYALGVRAGRVSALEMPIETTVQCCRDLQAAGMQFVVTLDHDRHDQVEALAEFVGAGLIAVEPGNEDDGDLWPWVYREKLERFCVGGERYRVPIAGTVISNTDYDSLWWAQLVRDIGVPYRDWPSWMRACGYFALHTYGPYPHLRYSVGPDGIRTEFIRARQVADGLPILVTEFGWANTPPATEQQQAEEITREWGIIEAQLKPVAAFLFQAHDGPNAHEREHRYGIRACAEDGQLAPLGAWKPVAHTFGAQFAGE